MAQPVVVKCEFLGGPLEGRLVPVPGGVESMVVRSTEGVALYQSEIVVEGPQVRRVFRLAGCVGGWS